MCSLTWRCRHSSRRRPVGWCIAAVFRPASRAGPATEPNRHALRVGGAVVVVLLVGFVVGPSYGVAPWMVAATADVVLMGVVGFVPWRDVPLLTAAGVAALAALVAVVVPSDAVDEVLGRSSPVVLTGIASGPGRRERGEQPARVVVGPRRCASHVVGYVAWLLGVNTAAVLVPIGRSRTSCGCESCAPKGSASVCVATSESPCPSRSPVPRRHPHARSRTRSHRLMIVASLDVRGPARSRDAR